MHNRTSRAYVANKRKHFFVCCALTDQYTYGRKVVLWTDHKPLVSISRKPLVAAPKRLQRLLIRLKQYDVDIHYKPGKEMYLADTLSRAYLENSEQSPVEVETESIHMIDELPISKKTYELIKHATDEDESMQTVKSFILAGWPDSKHELPAVARPYFSIRDELTHQDGIIFRGTRCVIPKTARPRVRERLHSAHTGVQSTLRRARDCVYWPGMTHELTDYISACETCNKYQPRQQKQPLLSHDLPNRPWQKIGIDLCTVDNMDYLCSVDYFSDYFEIDSLPHSKDAKAVIKRLKRHFATHGIPDTIQSDNGPPFSSREFADFANEYEFEHNTSSPEYSQSNGKVESAVKIAKRLIRKTNDSQGDIYLALLAWRNTPTEGMNSSPAQRLYGRRTKTNLPTASQLLKPSQNTQDDVRKRKQVKQAKQKQYFDRHVRALPELQAGETVRILPKANAKKWEKAQVQGKVNIRSYKVVMEDGREFRRNRKHLRSTPEKYFQPSEPYIPSRETPPETRNSMTTTDSHTDTHSEQQNTNVRRSTRERKTPSYLQDYVT